MVKRLLIWLKRLKSSASKQEPRDQRRVCQIHGEAPCDCLTWESLPPYERLTSMPQDILSGHCLHNGRRFPADDCIILQANIATVKALETQLTQQKALIGELMDAVEKTLAALVSYKRYTPQPYKQSPIYIIGAHEAEKLCVDVLEKARSMGLGFVVDGEVCNEEKKNA